jgi:hypothetical protein
MVRPLGASRSNWWLASSNSVTNFTNVNNNGNPDNNNATNANGAAPDSFIMARSSIPAFAGGKECPVSRERMSL